MTWLPQGPCSSAPLSRKGTLISSMVPASSDIPGQLLAPMHLAVIPFPLRESDRLGSAFKEHVPGPEGDQGGMGMYSQS